MHNWQPIHCAMDTQWYLCRHYVHYAAVLIVQPELLYSSDLLLGQCPSYVKYPQFLSLYGCHLHQQVVAIEQDACSSEIQRCFVNLSLVDPPTIGHPHIDVVVNEQVQAVFRFALDDADWRPADFG